MEILELQKRINANLMRVNSAKSISEKRRYFVYLGSLLATYNELTGENVQMWQTNNKAVMKHTHIELLSQELEKNKNFMQKISSGMLESKLESECNFRDRFVVKTYSPKYLFEVLESFLGVLGNRHYKVYKNIINNNDLVFNKEFAGGLTIFDYQKLKSVIFTSKDKTTLASLLTLVHELGHAYEYDYTKYSRKPFYVNKFNVTTEVFSMLNELLMIDYLKKINFDLVEVNKLEEKFYNDIINYAFEIYFAFSLRYLYFDDDSNLIIYDYNEAIECENELIKKYGHDFYVTNDINLEDSVNYMYGGLIATIYRHYYNQDHKFMNEISKHFLDYEAYDTKEIINRLPFVNKELEEFSILKKKLCQIKTNQF